MWLVKLHSSLPSPPKFATLSCSLSLLYYWQPGCMQLMWPVVVSASFLPFSVDVQSVCSYVTVVGGVNLCIGCPSTAGGSVDDPNTDCVEFLITTAIKIIPPRLLCFGWTAHLFLALSVKQGHDIEEQLAQRIYIIMCGPMCLNCHICTNCQN